MADRRMIHRKAAVSSDLAELRRRQGADALAFFYQLLPFYDRWGCVPDDPYKLRGMACPTWDDVNVADVKRWVTWMIKRGMLVRVTGPEGDRGLRNVSFEEHQRGTKFDREAPSPYEPADVSRQWARERTKSPQVQEPPDRKGTRSGPGPRKGKEGKGSTTTLPPSPTPSPPPVESAGSGLELDPRGAQAQTPEVNGHDHERPRLDMEAIAAEAPPIVRDAILRARRKAIAE